MLPSVQVIVDFIRLDEFDDSPKVKKAIKDKIDVLIVGKGRDFYVRKKDCFGDEYFFLCDGGGNVFEFMIENPDPNLQVIGFNGMSGNIFYKGRRLNLPDLNFIQVAKDKCFLFEGNEVLCEVIWDNGRRPRTARSDSSGVGEYGIGSWHDKYF